MAKGPGDVDRGAMTIVGVGSDAALQVIAQGNTPSSTSAGGTVNVDNSGNTGAGLVVFSAQPTPSGRLLVARASSSTFNQTVAYFENAGTGHAVHANNTAATPNSTGSALNVTSTNSGASDASGASHCTRRNVLTPACSPRCTNDSANGSAQAKITAAA